MFLVRNNWDLQDRGVTRFVTRPKTQPLPHRFEVPGHVAVRRIELGIFHGHCDVLVTELLLKEVEGHSGSSEVDGCGMSMVVDRVVVDPE